MLRWILGSGGQEEERVDLDDEAEVGKLTMAQLGKEISKQAGGIWPRPGPTKAMIEELGGKDAFIQIFVRFYDRLLDDPVMNVLFRESRLERPPEEHGKLLGSFVLNFITGDNGYRELRRQGHGFGQSKAHIRAKRCPMRPEQHQGRGFTVTQKHTWLGHMDQALRLSGASPQLRKALLTTLSRRMFVYGPFIKE